jgi:hypothetical protein
MKKFYNSFLKKRAISEIKRLGSGICEIVVDIPLSFSTIDTIEFDDFDNTIMVHVFELPEYDISYDFDDLEIEDKIQIIKSLKAI